MYDDFWAGYNSGNGFIVTSQPTGSSRDMSRFVPGSPSEQKIPAPQYRPSKRPGIYDKSKFIRMQGPNGEVGEIYADGKMFIAYGTKKWARKFGSRPFAIRYMQQRGWVLL